MYFNLGCQSNFREPGLNEYQLFSGAHSFLEAFCVSFAVLEQLLRQETRAADALPLLSDVYLAAVH